MKHPLAYTQHEITMLEDRCHRQDARIEVLEAALREIVQCSETYPANLRRDSVGMGRIARAALDKDHDSKKLREGDPARAALNGVTRT